MKSIRILLFLVVTGLLFGCGTTEPPRELSSGELPGGMLGFGGEDYTFWDDWTPREPAPMEPAAGSSIALFDAWSVADEAFRERLWDSTFHMLSAVKMSLPSTIDRQGLKSILMRFSVELERTQFEFAFFTRDDGQAEGIVLRIVEPEGSGLWIEGIRRANESTSPYRWTLRVEPAFEETPGFVVWWERLEDQWATAIASGAGSSLQEAVPWHPIETEAFLQLWNHQIWEAVTAQNYLEPSFERIAITDGAALATGWPATLGLDVEDRGLENFVDDSVFWPRSANDALEFFQ